MKQLFIGTYLFLICTLLFVQFILGPVINKIAKVHLRDSIIEYNRQLARGVFYMMDTDLLRLPEEEWPSRIIQLSPQFGYKISLQPISQLSLSQQQKGELYAGEIAVIDDGEYLYHRVGQSDYVLCKGPFSNLKIDSGYFNFLIWLLVIAVIGIFTFICVTPYWWQLRKLSNAAIAFGNGHLDTRVQVSKFSNLMSLSLAFNTMAQRIQQLISSHKELTNAVSHELRTPIARLRFGLEMLTTTEDVVKRADFAEELQTDVNELDDLVSELLTFARFDRDKPVLSLCPHHLARFLEQVIGESLATESLTCQLTCRFDPDQEIPIFDAKYMARAIGNLLQNAIRYAPQKIEVTAEKSGTRYFIHVDDDGPGIPEGDRRKVFEPFVRLDISRSRSSGGYGLGLAIVQRILEWHSGEVEASKSPLGGARLTVSWPS